MKKSKYLFNLFIIIAVSALSAWFLWQKGVLNQETFKNISLLAIAPVSALYFLHVALNALINFLCVRFSIKNWNYPSAFSELIYGRLGSEITPLKSGHFPFRALYFNQRGYSLYEAMTAFTECQIIASVASIINYSVIFVITLTANATLTVGETAVGLWLIVLVGLAFHVGALSLFLILAFVKPLQIFFINLCLKITARKKSEEEKRKFFEEQTQKYEIYRERIITMLKAPQRYFIPLFLYVADMFLSASLIYVSFLSISGASFSLNDFFLFYISALCATYITNIVPLPGGSGSSEAAFVLVFSNIIGSNLAGSVLITWRLGSFYLPVAIEAVFFACVTVLNAKKLKSNEEERS